MITIITLNFLFDETKDLRNSVFGKSAKTTNL
jgi:hypothetical protein